MRFTKSGALSYPFSAESKWLLADRMNLSRRAELLRVKEYVIQDPVKETAQIWLTRRKKLFSELEGLRKWLRYRKLQRFATLESQKAIQRDPFILVSLFHLCFISLSFPFQVRFMSVSVCREIRS